MAVNIQRDVKMCTTCRHNLLCISVVSNKYRKVACPRCGNHMLRLFTNCFVAVPDSCLLFWPNTNMSDSARIPLSTGAWVAYKHGAVAPTSFNTATYYSIFGVACQRFCVDCAEVEAGRLHRKLLKARSK